MVLANPVLQTSNYTLALYVCVCVYTQGAKKKGQQRRRTRELENRVGGGFSGGGG